MRLAVAFVIFVCLSACGMTPNQTDDFAEQNPSWRQHQATLDADAIMQGMANARQQAAELARSAP